MPSRPFAVSDDDAVAGGPPKPSVRLRSVPWDMAWRLPSQLGIRSSRKGNNSGTSGIAVSSMLNSMSTLKQKVAQYSGLGTPGRRVRNTNDDEQVR